MPNLNQFTDEDLQRELERRANLKKKASKPEQLNPHGSLETLRELCQSYIDTIADEGYVDEDHKDYIFEAAMEVFFGGDVWDWINRNS